MIKNKRIKKNWSEEDVQILLWVISKYADKKKLEDVEKDLVFSGLSRTHRIGKPSPRSSPGSPASPACSSGSVSKRSTLPPTTGASRKATFWPN
jgi:hypothetical protein